MYGAILGDIIGSPFEFDRGDKTKNFDLFSEGCGFTDDSVIVDAPLKQHSLDFVACRQVALYTVIILQKEKVSEHSSWTVAYPETW